MNAIETRTRASEQSQKGNVLAAPKSTAAAPAFGVSKIADRHLDRQAIVYVRQSRPQQILKHRESALLQYDLACLAERLGWSRDRTAIVDEDQGMTAQSAEGRQGFQWLLAEVALDHVGIVLGIEMSRLARSCKDWYQLLEVCALFGVLLADQDGIYDPANYNDRLLLGLKGTMSEAELHIMRGRLNAGRLNKAQRAELFSHPPIGYVRSASTGRWELDPDEQAQHVVRLVFEKFADLGSGIAVLVYLVKHQIQLGVRPHGGPNRGQLEWRRPTTATLMNMLHNPTYAGAYSYGRHPTDPRRKIPGRPGSGKVQAPIEQWHILKPDQLPAYITWEQFVANQKRLANNSRIGPGPGTAGEGPGLLGGLVVCGRCGYRMLVNYSGDKKFPQYVCKRAYLQHGGETCQSLSSSPVDELVGQQVLLALQPAALELSLQAQQDIQRERDRLHEHWSQRLERAKQEAERAFRQYNAVEPENRLIVRELERRWEQALVEQRGVQEEYDRFVQQEPRQLTNNETTSVRSLATDIPSLWSSDTTTFAERKEIIRCLVKHVVVNVQGNTEIVDVTIRWAGEFTSQHQIRRQVLRFEQLSDYSVLLTRITELREALRSSAEIADQLNREGFHPPKRSTAFSADSVRQLWARCKGFSHDVLLDEHEWWLSDLCRELHIPQPTMHEWRRKGWVHSRKLPGPFGRWILWADNDELNRLRQLRAQSRRRLDECYPQQLTTPKQRPGR